MPLKDSKNEPVGYVTTDVVALWFEMRYVDTCVISLPIIALYVYLAGFVFRQRQTKL